MADPQTLPSASDLYDEAQKSAPLPTASDLYAQAEKQFGAPRQSFLSYAVINPNQYSGPTADAVFDQGPFGRVLKAAGQGAADEWGAMKGVYSQKLYEAMDPEDAKNDKAIVKSGNEGWLRPLAAKIVAQEASNAINAVTAVARPVFAGFAGVAAGVQQLGEELPRQVGEPLEEALGALPALHGAVPHVPEGGFPEAAKAPDLRAPLTETQILTQARAKGVIGEGEAGYFGVGGVSPENATARQEAAQESGHLLLTDEKPEPDYVPTIDDLARKINPEAFDAVDKTKARLLDLRENLELSRKYVLGKGGSEEDLAPIRQNITALDEQLRDLIPDTADARTRAKEMLQSDSPEGDMFRDWVQATALEKALASVKEDTQDAYGRATDLIRDSAPSAPEETGKTATEAPTASTKGLNGQPDETEPGPAPTRPGKGFAETSPAGESVGSKGKPGTSGPGYTFKAPEELGLGGEKKVSGAARLLEEEALNNGILSGRLEGLPEYERLVKKEQVAAATKYTLDHFEDAKKVVTGEGPRPEGIHPEFILAAVKEIAAKTGDVDLVRDIIKSPLNAEVSRAGQTLGARAGLIDTDPVSLIEDAEKTKKEKSGNLKYDAALKQKTSKAVKDQVADIKASIDKATNQFKEDWNSFLKSIECEE